MVRDIERTRRISKYNNKSSIIQQEIHDASESVNTTYIAIYHAGVSIQAFTQGMCLEQISY
jgi:hypothetical protein